MSPNALIAKIDRKITAIHRDLASREQVDALSPASWQCAWDCHPTLRIRERSLFRRRGVAQIARAKIEAAQRLRAIKIPKAKKCPTCGQRSLLAA